MEVFGVVVLVVAAVSQGIVGIADKLEWYSSVDRIAVDAGDDDLGISEIDGLIGDGKRFPVGDALSSINEQAVASSGVEIYSDKENKLKKNDTIYSFIFYLLYSSPFYIFEIILRIMNYFLLNQFFPSNYLYD